MAINPQSHFSPDDDTILKIEIRKGDFDFIYNALESRKELFRLYERHNEDTGMESIWAGKRKHVESLQSSLLNQLPV